MMRPRTGTYEWAPHTDNCVTGCEHDCRYCFARYSAVHRWKRLREEDWPKMRIRPGKVNEPRKKLDGAVMFPTQHDITPSVLPACMTVIGKHLAVGTRLLIVSKPHLYCIYRIVSEFPGYQDHILFRFSIGAQRDDELHFWEPGAPCYGERRASLELAKRHGFETSVSAEPLLTPTVGSVCALVKDLAPVVTHSIWIGMLNKGSQRVTSAKHQRHLQRIEEGQTPERVRAIYEALKDHPLIRWKDAYKKMLGLPMAEVSESEVKK